MPGALTGGVTKLQQEELSTVDHLLDYGSPHRRQNGIGDNSCNDGIVGIDGISSGAPRQESTSTPLMKAAQKGHETLEEILLAGTSQERGSPSWTIWLSNTSPNVPSRVILPTKGDTTGLEIKRRIYTACGVDIKDIKILSGITELCDTGTLGSLAVTSGANLTVNLARGFGGGKRTRAKSSDKTSKPDSNSGSTGKGKGGKRVKGKGGKGKGKGMGGKKSRRQLRVRVWMCVL